MMLEQMRCRAKWIAVAFAVAALAAPVAQAMRTDVTFGNRSAPTSAVRPPASQAPTVVQLKTDGFDWEDAGIGAGLALAGALLGAGAAVATRHRGRLAGV